MFYLYPARPLSRVNIGIFFASREYWPFFDKCSGGGVLITVTNGWNDYILDEIGTMDHDTTENSYLC